MLLYWVYNEIAVLLRPHCRSSMWPFCKATYCDSATDQSEKKASYITHNDWSIAESQHTAISL